MSGELFRQIGIVGSGRMGESIFYHFNDFDYSLVWVFRKDELRESAIAKFTKKLRRMNKTGILDDRAYGHKTQNTRITTRLEDLEGCDLIVETIVENREIKTELFKTLDRIAKPACVFVSNSSSIKPSLICPNSVRRTAFAGLHFFYPVQFNRIVELIGTDACSSQTIESLRQFAQNIKKQPLVLTEKSAFILNKAFINFQAQAFRFRQERILSYKQIDGLIKKHIFAMGVFEFLDQVGLDVIAEASRHYFEDVEHKEFVRITIDETQKLVEKGFLGVKSGRGFYQYGSEGNSDERLDLRITPDEERKRYEQEVVNKLICLYVNTAYDFVDKGYCSEPELDVALSEYNGMEKGPFTLGNEVGWRKVYEMLMRYYTETGEKVFYPSASLASRAAL